MCHDLRAISPLILPVRALTNDLFPIAMSVILKVIKTVNSGLLVGRAPSDPPTKGIQFAGSVYIFLYS